MNISARRQLLVATTAYQPPTSHNSVPRSDEKLFQNISADQNQIPDPESQTDDCRRAAQLERNPPLQANSLTQQAAAPYNHNQPAS
jgi:hypothetical protein